MTYDQALEYIYSFRKMQKSPTHERIEYLLELFSSPHKRLSFIHIAGTNGKGSVAGALSSIFISAGYRTGLFTSPFVVEFGERIQVNGKYIEKERLCSIVSEIKEKTELLAEEMKPTVFELITLIAFIYFESRKCDIVILEAGIGGMHDSTNVIPSAKAAVFTSVSLDHTEMLGETVEEIAGEKSGIIKNEGIVVSYPVDEKKKFFTGQNIKAYEIFKKKAEEKSLPFYSPDAERLTMKKQNFRETVFTYKHLKLKTSLLGDHQTGNMITAAECALALKEKGERITDADIEKGIASFTVPCRMERTGENPLIILDGGHNEGCMLALKNMTEKYLSEKRITLLMASMKDKDYKKSLEIILPLCENAVFTCTDRIRGENEHILKKEAESLCENTYACKNAAEALEKARETARRDGVILCCGSFYLVSDIRKILTDD